MIDAYHIARPARRYPLRHMIEASRYGHQLAQLTQSQFEYTGVTRGQAAREARRPFWRLGPGR